MDREIKFRDNIIVGCNEIEFDLEEECKTEIEEMSQHNKSIKDKNNKQNIVMRNRLETGYYCNVCFKTVEDRDAWLSKVGMQPSFFIDGYELAKKTGAEIDKSDIDYGHYRHDKKWLDLIM